MEAESSAFRTFKGRFQATSRLNGSRAPTVHPINQRTPVHTQRRALMNTSLTTRLNSFAASIAITLAIVWMVADYAYPPAPAMQLASAAR